MISTPRLVEEQETDSMNLDYTKTKARGNVLAGCLIALGVALVLAIIATIFVATSWRGWVSDWISQGITAVLEEAPVSEAERLEIVAHIDTLMTRFDQKEIGFSELGRVVEELAESPLTMAAMMMSANGLYIENSELPEEEKEQARIELARFSLGLFDESIDSSVIQDVLDPITTNTPDDNDIVLNVTIESTGNTTRALRSADEVTIEDIRLLVANAKAQADEAGVTLTPEPIDLSNEVAIAIANALGEDPSLWLPAGVEVPSRTQDTDDADEPEADLSSDVPDDDGP